MERVFFISLFSVVFSGVFAQGGLPYEPKENFGFELDYSFKTKPPPENSKVSLVENADYTAQPLPYLKVRLSFNDLPDHYFRFRVENNKGSIVKNKKIKTPETYILDMGFSDDLKDRVTPHKYTIFFLTKDKERISMIQIEVEENGNLLLNGEFHGRI